MFDKGWFALDIDGTLTHGAYSIPKIVISYLKNKYEEGWKILILTGRSFPFASLSVKEIDFPYVLSTQNGSAAWSMPEQKILFENFFKKEEFYEIEEMINLFDLAFMVYGSDFRCYYKRNNKHEFYIDLIAKLNNQEKIPFDKLSDINQLTTFPIAKMAGNFEETENLLLTLLSKALCESSLIKDPFNEGVYLLLLTKKGVSKGSCIDRVLSIHGESNSLVIAAGNDHNDLSMFNSADIKIAMKGCPKELSERADIIAPLCEDFGIIQGLDEAILLASKVRKSK